jgi:hypothetical protein
MEGGRKMRPKFWDEYEIKARYLPCLISVIPLSHFLIRVLDTNFLGKLLENSAWLLVISNVGFPLIFVLCLMQIQVVFAKDVIEKIVFGQGGIHFSTTDMLLLSGGLISQEKKDLIRQKVSTIFPVVFPTKDAEVSNLDNARMCARDAVELIRKKVGKGIMTYQYNIRYGFMRNLIGGIIWAVPGSIGCVVLYAINKNWGPMLFFTTVICIYLIFFFCKKRILSNIALSYANTLLSEYLALE